MASDGHSSGNRDSTGRNCQQRVLRATVRKRGNSESSSLSQQEKEGEVNGTPIERPYLRLDQRYEPGHHGDGSKLSG